jgi:hypothetical protein
MGFLQDLRRLHHLSACREHCGVGQPLLYQLKADETVIDIREGGPAELGHVDLYALTAQAFHK